MNTLGKTKLEDVINLGDVITEKLRTAEIYDVEMLRQQGAEKVFTRLITIEDDCPIQMLYAIEGAIQNIRWHGLDKERKEELKTFFKLIKKK